MVTSLVILGACGGTTDVGRAYERIEVRGAGAVASATSVTLAVYGIDARATAHRVRATWKSSDSTVAAVDREGMVTGRRVGEARVRATVGALQAEHLMHVRPASMELQLVGTLGTTEPYVPSGRLFTARAVFRDARQQVLEVPWPVGWSVEDARAGAVRSYESPLQREATVQSGAPGLMTLRASAQGVGATRVVGVYTADAEPLEILETVVVVTDTEAGGWEAAPVLRVRALASGMQVRRVLVQGGPLLCTVNALTRAQATSLFGEQPSHYTWSTIGPRPAQGSEVRMELDLQYPDARIVRRLLTARVEVLSPGTVVDPGVRGMTWQPCDER
ncbi:MAG: Ig-like domain-containing protein [Gemmatimonadetes bacterium]|nr:Ig-like domain-containing protein [Gemmatimonadota bacterium]